VGGAPTTRGIEVGAAAAVVGCVVDAGAVVEAGAGAEAGVVAAGLEATGEGEGGGALAAGAVDCA